MVAAGTAGDDLLNKGYSVAFGFEETGSNLSCCPCFLVVALAAGECRELLPRGKRSRRQLRAGSNRQYDSRRVRLLGVVPQIITSIWWLRSPSHEFNNRQRVAIATGSVNQVASNSVNSVAFGFSVHPCRCSLGIWWLRSPGAGGYSGVRAVAASGAWYNYSGLDGERAGNSQRVAFGFA